MGAQGAAVGLDLLLLSFCEVSPRQGSHECNEEPPNPAGMSSLCGNVLPIHLELLKARGIQGGFKGETFIAWSRTTAFRSSLWDWESGAPGIQEHISLSPTCPCSQQAHPTWLSDVSTGEATSVSMWRVGRDTSTNSCCLPRSRAEQLPVR